MCSCVRGDVVTFRVLEMILSVGLDESFDNTDIWDKNASALRAQFM
jgi:hypothetical protein